ncbi:hypothetical protein QUB63_03555 [Microcoleus sp. ARI1-B5]|uniref:hypothetical protein n=1 Tax=unclassified Microcoleus TaxID=2642155 RepID=UPI002FD0B8F4
MKVASTRERSYPEGNALSRGSDNLPTYKALQKPVTFSHRQGDRGSLFFELRQKTSAIALSSPSTIYQLTKRYKKLSLFLTGRAIGVLYSLS